MEESGLLEVTSRCCYQKKGELARQNRKVVCPGWINQTSASQLCFLTCGPAAKRTVQNFLYRGSRFESYWKIFLVLFCNIKSHYFTCFSNISPSPRAVIPQMGSGQVLPVREKEFWSHSDLSLNPSCTNIYLPCSICFRENVRLSIPIF